MNEVNWWTIKILYMRVRGFSGSLVFRTPDFHCWGPRFNPLLKTKIPQTTHHSQKKWYLRPSLQIERCRRNCCNDRCSCTSPKRVLEDSSHFTFSIRNTRCSFYKSSNYPSQSQQGLIDISSFLSSPVNCSRMANVLTVCKINLEF